MSYSRSYRETITVSGSKSATVSYPASQNGGSTTVTVHYTEHVPVNVNIHVDTNPFDSSIQNCNRNVNALTGAVVATEAAQIASIHKNSKKIAGTIIQGFFKNIRFELSAQITELTQKIDTHLMHLHELSKQLINKQKQMETDYYRTSDRYLKIFGDLNNELSNRISELNRPAFQFKQQMDKQSDRNSGNDLVNTVTIFGAEGGNLQSKISASITKKRALDAINQANVFLRKQKILENTINRSMLNEEISALRYSPVCLVEMYEDKDQTSKVVYQPDYLSKIEANKVIEYLEAEQWSNLSKEKRESIQRYFISELNTTYFSADSHTRRVREAMIKMFDQSVIKSV